MMDDATLSRWMKAALNAAVRGVAHGQAPFGAAVYSPQGVQLAVEHNRVVELMFPSAHAEVLAIRLACRVMETLDLKGCWLIATCEPCPMCIATAALVGINHVAYGASREEVERCGYDSLCTSCVDVLNLFPSPMHVRPGILSPECQALLLNHPFSAND